MTIPEGLFFCIRVYSNWSVKYTIRNEDGKKSWLEYNKMYRPGNTLFVNYEYIEDTGYLTPRRQAEFDAVLEIIKSMKVEMREFKLRDHWDSDMRMMRKWYGDDPYLINDHAAYAYEKAWRKKYEQSPTSG